MFCYEKNVLAVHDDLVPLIQDLASFHHSARVGPFGIVLFVLNCNPGPQGVADENWLDETQLVESVSERDGINPAGGEPNANGKDHGPVSNTLAEWRLPRKLRIHMMREEISGVPRVDNDVGFRNRTPRGYPLSPDRVVFEIFCAVQSSPRRLARIPCRQ
jgi:hypothetical protein